VEGLKRLVCFLRADRMAVTYLRSLPFLESRRVRQLRFAGGPSLLVKRQRILRS
jgi:hypothetical protein